MGVLGGEWLEDMLDSVAGLVGRLHGLRAGCALFEVTPRSDLGLDGFSYKHVKTLAVLGAKARGAAGIPRTPYAHVSPVILPDGSVLGRWWRGWHSRPPGAPGRLVLRGGSRYYVRLGWVGVEGREYAATLWEFLEATPLASVEVVEVEERLVYPEHSHEASLALATPAQFKVHGWDGVERVLAEPGASRLLQAALRAAASLAPAEDLEAHAAMAALALYTAQTGGEWAPVTLYLDRRRPTAWALAGWARVTLTRSAPEPVGRLLGLLGELALYIGVGKSRG
ncbi:MAG: hypothetical protein GSR80_000853, partial [Desulfurococcales archaeon]|nr:hypothetical protein [Desulfurococcales archaeon]